VRYKDYVDALRNDRAETLLLHQPIDYAIDREPVFNIPHGRIYNLSEVEVKTLNAYSKTNLANGLTQRASSSVAAPIVFVKKIDASLRPCVNYRVLNKATVKNQYLHSLISEILDELHGAKIFRNQDHRNSYVLIRSTEGAKYKSQYHTWYGQFEFEAMPWGLTTSPATFQAYINDYLWPVIDYDAVCFLDERLIYSTSKEEQEEVVQKVLEWLRQFGLYAKSEKCHLGVPEVDFLWVFKSPNRIGMESDQISMIKDWPTPESIWDLQVRLGFMNFDWQFIRIYAKVTTPKSDLLNNGETSRMPKQYKWECTWDAELAFRKLKRAFNTAPIFHHFDLAMASILRTDASGIDIPGILN